MAEKVVIYELDIAVEEAVKSTIELNKAIEQQKAKLKELKEAGKENTAEYVLLNAEMKANQAELRTQNNLITKYTQSNNASVDSIKQMRLELSAVSIAWAKEAKANGENSEAAKKLAERKKFLTETLEREEKATGDARRGVGKYKEGIIEAAKEQANAIPGANKFLGILSKFGPIGAGIAAGAALISAPFIAFFKSFDKGMDMAERKISGFKNAIGVLQLEVGRLGQKIIGNEDSAIKWGTALQVVGRYFGGLANVLPGFNKWLKETSDKMNQASKDGELMALMNQKLTDAENEHITVRSETNRKIADSKLLYEDETKSIKERMQGLKDSLNLEIETLSEEKKLQDGRIKNLYLEKGLKKERWNEQDEKRLQEAIAKSDDLETESLIKRRKLQSTINKAQDEFNKQELDRKKKEAETSVDNLNYELEKYKLTNQSKVKYQKTLTEEIIKAESDRLEEINKLNKDKLDKQLSSGLIKQNDYNLAIIQQETDKNNAILELNNQLNQQKLEQNEEARQKQLEAAQIDFENQQALFEDNILSQLESQKKANEFQKADEIRQAKLTGASVELINKKYAKADLEIERAKKDAKLSLAGDFAKNIATIFGENTAVGKAAAVAETTINTYKSATAAYSSLAGIPVVGPVLGIAAAGAAVASGLANVKKILAVKAGLPGEKSVSSSGAESGGASLPTTEAAQISKITSDPTIGQGIVSRQTNASLQDKINLQPTLVVDSVTSKQNQEYSQNQTATI